MKKFQILTISEGAAGMRSQIEGLANLLGHPYRNINLKIRFFFKILPVQMIPAITFIIKNIDDYKIKNPTILISCGKKSVKASIALKKKNKNIFNIHVQDPKTSHEHFDLIVAPKHDELNVSNSIASNFAIHNINYKQNINLKNNKTINFIIGGSNKYFKFGKNVQENILENIKLLSKKYFVQIIPSRRTPLKLIQKIKNNKIKNTNLHLNTYNSIEYGNFLCRSIANIVTWESISMISESVYSGVGTFIYTFDKKNLPKKYAYFHKELIRKKYIREFSINFIPFKTSVNENLSELRNKILNKISRSPIFNT